MDDVHRVALLLAQRIEEGAFEDNCSIDAIADQFQLSSRQIRRITEKELGVSPLELITTRRLLLAKQLLTETSLPVTEVAFASGFKSLRRFNDAFITHYRMPPSQLRKTTSPPAHRNIRLQLAFRPPFDWNGMVAFLSIRAIKGVEWVHNGTYSRLVHMQGHKGYVQVSHLPEKHAVMVEASPSLLPVLPKMLMRIRRLFDLNARPDIINAHLSQYDMLKPRILQNPGLRVPGCFNGFELACRAIFGQQVTVKAATTIASRFVERFGEPYASPFPALTHLFPSPESIASASVGDIAQLGMPAARAKSVIAMAEAIATHNIVLEPHMSPENTMQALTALPGIGAWTAHYIAMRALQWPDAFPKEDIAIRKALGNVSAKEAEALSQPWRPWRAYATLHLWQTIPSGEIPS